mmetsp:Transcript_72546/g.206582  ORF Transcript_72546/g.206582 Transcript_72546/m.206582 type:complete len:223 (-) Transcript_72546:18-686(-)
MNETPPDSAIASEEPVFLMSSAGVPPSSTMPLSIVPLRSNERTSPLVCATARYRLLPESPARAEKRIMAETSLSATAAPPPSASSATVVSMEDSYLTTSPRPPIVRLLGGSGVGWPGSGSPVSGSLRIRGFLPAMIWSSRQSVRLRMDTTPRGPATASSGSSLMDAPTSNANLETTQASGALADPSAHVSHGTESSGEPSASKKCSEPIASATTTTLMKLPG